MIWKLILYWETTTKVEFMMQPLRTISGLRPEIHKFHPKNGCRKLEPRKELLELLRQFWRGKKIIFDKNTHTNLLRITSKEPQLIATLNHEARSIPLPFSSIPHYLVSLSHSRLSVPFILQHEVCFSRSLTFWESLVLIY